MTDCPSTEREREGEILRKIKTHRVIGKEKEAGRNNTGHNYFHDSDRKAVVAVVVRAMLLAQY